MLTRRDRAPRRGTNLGATGLRRRRRPGDPMQDFDALPAELRRWLANAALPWSPESCRRIWLKAGAEGASIAERLDRLDRAERRTLARDPVLPDVATEPLCAEMPSPAAKPGRENHV